MLLVHPQETHEDRACSACARHPARGHHDGRAGPAPGGAGPAPAPPPPFGEATPPARAPARLLDARHRHPAGYRLLRRHRHHHRARREALARAALGLAYAAGCLQERSLETLVQLARRQRQARHPDPLVPPLIVLLGARQAPDGARGRFLVEDPACLGGKILADVLRLGEKLVQHARIEHLGDGERILALHVRRALRVGPRPLGCRLGLGRTQIDPRDRRHPLDLRVAAARTHELAPLLLRGEVRGRAEPALEAVTLAAKQIENNHLTDSTMLRMGRYRNDAAALDALVEADRVHRDVYLDATVFELEMERLWSRAWIYAGHESQIRNEGDYLTVDVAGQPLIVLRHGDGSVRVLLNRCAHKGTKLVGEPAGHCGKTLRCPYHAWTYRLDGSILNIPLAQGYDGTRLAETEASRGLTAIRNVAVYRGFIFVRLSPQGAGFRDYFGAS